MKIEKIKIKKFKGLENFEAEINQQNILLVGENGVGKSSTIQFIKTALGSKDTPINENGESGELKLIKDGKEIFVSVSFKENKPVIKVKGDGLRIDNNKSALFELFGNYDFSIDDFLKSNEKKQVEFLQTLFDEETQSVLKKLNTNILNDFDERTQINRDIKNLDGSIKSSKLAYLPEFELRKIEQVNANELIEKLNKANELNLKVNSFREKMFAKEKEINELKEKLKEAEKQWQQGFDWLEQNKEVDVRELQLKVSDVQNQNENYFAAQKILKEYEKKSELENLSGELTAKIESGRETIKDTVKQMITDIDGLDFDGENLTYLNSPLTFENLSTSEKIELQIKIWKKFDKTGIMLIENGESIGTQRLQAIKELADKEKFQIIMEEVRRGVNELNFEILN